MLNKDTCDDPRGPQLLRPRRCPCPRPRPHPRPWPRRPRPRPRPRTTPSATRIPRTRLAAVPAGDLRDRSSRRAGKARFPSPRAGTRRRTARAGARARLPGTAPAGPRGPDRSPEGTGSTTARWRRRARSGDAARMPPKTPPSPGGRSGSAAAPAAAFWSAARRARRDRSPTARGPARSPGTVRRGRFGGEGSAGTSPGSASRRRGPSTRGDFFRRRDFSGDGSARVRRVRRVRRARVDRVPPEARDRRPGRTSLPRLRGFVFTGAF